MNWKTLSSEEQFLELLSNEPVFAVFKHSTRCSISSMAKNRLERDWSFDFPIYYLDLLKYRPLSDLIASKSGVHHESPQLIIFQSGSAVYHASHSGITVDDIKDVLINV